jgi:hypothetical protein
MRYVVAGKSRDVGEGMKVGRGGEGRKEKK